MITLRGITWAHSRGYVPLMAAAEAWHDLHPDIVIEWHKRSFWGFGEGALDEVARDYDLIVFDHPHTGTAAVRGLLLPLDIEPGECAGLSRESYVHDGRLYGLPIDGACQTAAYRADLMAKAGETLPSTWNDVIALARRTGRVRCAFSRMGALGMVHSVVAGLGAPAGVGSAYLEPSAGHEALARVKELFDVCGPETFSPVQILGEMATNDEVMYAPLLYCYSNYCRDGFARQKLNFAAPAAGSTLGGAGLGVSTFSMHKAAALDFARWLMSVPCQSGLYLHAQGQPALRSVWNSDSANALTGGFFRELLPVMDNAWLRPTRPGYSEFQSAAGTLVHEYLKGKSTMTETIRQINSLRGD